MRSVLLLIIALSGIFETTGFAQIVPYVRAKPPVKKNAVGLYPDSLHNAKVWNGREPGSYSIKFKINGLNPFDTVYLADNHLDGKYLRDTAVVDKKGVADFTGNFKLERGMYLFVFPQKRGYFEFIVDDAQKFMITTDTAFQTGDHYTPMKVEGSEQNQGFKEYQVGKSQIVEQIINIDEKIKSDTNKVVREPLEKERRTLMEKKNNYDKEYIKAHPDHLLSRFLYAMEEINVPTELPTLPDGKKDSAAPYKYYRMHFFDHIDFNEDGLMRMPVNVMKQKLDLFFDKVLILDPDTCIRVCDELIKKAENSIEVEKYLIWYLTNRFETSTILGLDKVFVHLAEENYCKGRAWWADSATVHRMCENVEKIKPTLPGMTAPNIELRDINGKWITTSSIKASYTIMVFWDPTCGHCREVMPKVAKIYADNKAKGWKVIALHGMDKKKEFDEYLKEHPDMVEFTHLVRGEVQSRYWESQLLKYNIYASPTIFVLDENKVVIANKMDVDKMEEFINHMDKMKKKKGEGEF